MPKPYLRDLRADAESLQREAGEWVIVGVETSAPWPTTAQVVPYLGHDFILRPGTPDRAPTVCLNARAHGLTATEARDAIHRFGSSMAWAGDWRFETTMWMSGTHPFGIGRMLGGIAQDFFDVEELSAIADEDAATALAFFREGISAHSPFYGFLNLYKVIGFIHPDGTRRGAWFDAALPALTEANAAARLAELAAAGINASTYLRDEGRHAIAHAERGTYVNPDRGIDHLRITRDLPIMQALARRAIEERFDIHHRLSRARHEPSPTAGFLKLFGDDVVSNALDGVDITGLVIQTPDNIDVVVRRGATTIALEGLAVSGLKQVQGGIALWLRNATETVQANFVVDLVNGTLELGPEDIECLTNASSRSSIEQALRVHEFVWTYLLNGVVEVWDAETGSLLGKTAVFFPVNAMARPQWHEDTVARLTGLLENAIAD
ncbi:methylamine utilization protein MauJ [Xanthomonas sp. NCPPB 2632]|uniref:methylamine utilization protein MauJ n=1 Tax=Xanthomonas sp. NCPPB 2632 TaxID=3240912 RepID=UPI003517CA72